jgi:hypothetical protein
MHDAGAWRNNLEVVESTSSPFEELKSLSVARKFQLLIELSCIESTCSINLN